MLQSFQVSAGALRLHVPQPLPETTPAPAPPELPPGELPPDIIDPPFPGGPEQPDQQPIGDPGLPTPPVRMCS